MMGAMLAMVRGVAAEQQRPVNIQVSLNNGGWPIGKPSDKPTGFIDVARGQSINARC